MRRIVTLILLISFGSCKEQSAGFVQAEGAMLFLKHVDRPGKHIEPYDFVALSIIQQTEDGLTVYNSSEEDGRAVYRYREPARVKGGFSSALGLLSEGDSASFMIMHDSIVREEGLTKESAGGKYLVYHIKVHKVIPRGHANDSTFNAQVDQYRAMKAEEAKAQEPVTISSFVKQKGLTPFKRMSGLQYVVEKAGEGAPAKPGDTVLVNFTVRFLSGRIFETNVAEIAEKEGVYREGLPYQPARFEIMETPSNTGFYEALTIFPKGAKVMLIIPSKLAFGANYYKGLQPFTPLRCDMEILEIVKRKSPELHFNK